MGLRNASDKWSWVAIDLMSHTLPKMHVLLDRLSEAVDPATVEIIKSIIKETGATAPKLQGLLDELSQAVDPIAITSIIDQTEATMPKLRGLLVNLSQAVDPIAITSLVKEMEATMPKLNGLLDKVSQSVDPVAITSLIKEMDATIFVIKCMSASLFIIFALTIIFLCTYTIKHCTQFFHSNYGGTETMARTCANLMKLHSERVQRNGIGIGAERTIIFLIGEGDSETTEAYLRFDYDFRSDVILKRLLPQGQSFVFRTIKDALSTLDVCCTSEEKQPKTLFILLLVSTSRNCHVHETFQMPSSLRDHCYAIVGTGIGDDGVPPHRLSKTSKGPDGELLTESLPLGPANAGVRFY